MSIIITGTPTGSVEIQASNDPDTNETQTNQPTQQNAQPSNPPAVAPVNWVTIANSQFAVASTGETMWNVNFVGYNFVRVKYTDASGGTSTATAKIIFNGKG